MNTPDFHAAIAPQLKVAIAHWLQLELTCTQSILANTALAGCLRQQLLQERVSGASEQLLVSLKDSAKLSDKIDQCCDVFFTTMQRYAHIDATGTVAIRIGSYHPRLKTFLGRLKTMLSNAEAATPKRLKASV